MNKTAIKKFAIEARQKLIKDIAYQMRLLGITEKGIQEKLPQSAGDVEFYDIGTSEPYRIAGNAIAQRQALVQHLRERAKEEDFADAYTYVIEEVAYTWFNRLIAIRFMEVNDYLPGRVRVLSSESPTKIEPDIVTTPFDADLEFTEGECAQISQWREENRMDDLFRLLFIKECNALNAYLPELFEQTKDYSELLLNLSVTNPDGVVYHLVHDIDEADFDVEQGGQVEIIGWLYQYYNIEPKKAVTSRPSGQKIKKEELPAVTQLFTPDWIVRYMVENSLGRLWIQGRMDTAGEVPAEGENAPNHPAEQEMAEKFQWKYYLPEAKQEAGVENQLQSIRKEYAGKRLEDIKFLDPCMGSGHILVYAFDVFMQLYLSQGYDERDAVESILTHNLYGLDIDDRAFQLSYFALYMKACQYGGRRILKKGLKLNICAIQESNGLQQWKDATNEEIPADAEGLRQIDTLISLFRDAKEYGSLIDVPEADYHQALNWLNEAKDSKLVETLSVSQWIHEVAEKLPAFVKQAQIMGQLYNVVSTNPPYLGGSMSTALPKYLKKNYADEKGDLFAAFIKRCHDYLKLYGLQAMITMHAWMFDKTYKNLRHKVLHNSTFVNMVHLGARAFEEISGEKVRTTTFVIANEVINTYIAKYSRETNINKAEGKRVDFLGKKNIYRASIDEFLKMPNQQIAYWLSKELFDGFDNDTLGMYVDGSVGIQTGDNDKFIHYWSEVAFDSITFNARNIDDTNNGKWYPYNKGGGYRKWSGNDFFIVNWKNNGQDIKLNSKITGHHYQDYKDKLKFKELITWSRISTTIPSFRYKHNGYLSDMAGFSLYPKGNNIYNILGFCNSVVAEKYLRALSSSLNYMLGTVCLLPIAECKKNVVNAKVSNIVKENICLSEDDWNSFETSWNFQRHPLLVEGVADMAGIVGGGKPTLEQKYEEFKAACEDRFDILKENEEELNRIFIDIYGLQDELTPEVADKDVTVARVFDTEEDKPESMKGNNYVLMKADVVKSLLSYAVGCMFGRYSLDEDGLIYAGGEFDLSRYQTFQPDKDNVIPITDEDYFEDDIVGCFVKWMKAAFGAEKLEKNLAFIADALGTKGAGSRERIRTYFLKDFFADHVKTYKKCPIYWLYDSGTQNGFKALVYMHRYDADTTGRVRVDYLHRMEQTYDTEMANVRQDLEQADSTREQNKLRKRLAKLDKQRKECQAYDEQIAQPALARIDIDLDDGVKVNYKKVQTVDGKTYHMLHSIQMR